MNAKNCSPGTGNFCPGQTQLRPTRASLHAVPTPPLVSCSTCQGKVEGLALGTSRIHAVITLFPLPEESQKTGKVSRDTAKPGKTTVEFPSIPECKWLGSALILSQIPAYSHSASTRPCAPVQSSWLSSSKFNFPQHITTHNCSLLQAGREAPLNTSSTQVHHGDLQLCSYS